LLEHYLRVVIRVISSNSDHHLYGVLTTKGNTSDRITLFSTQLRRSSRPVRKLPTRRLCTSTATANNLL